MDVICKKLWFICNQDDFNLDGIEDIYIYIYMHTHVDMSKGWTNPQQGSGHFFHKVNWGVAHKIVDHAKLVN